MTLPEHSSISPFVRDGLAVVHQQSLELIVRGASLDAVLEALCDGIDALDPNLVSSVLLADPDGQRLWPKAGRRVPEDYKQLITPLPIAPSMGACGPAAFRKERVISADIASDPLWSGPAEHCRRVALQHGFRAAWSVPIVSDKGELLGTFGLHHTQSKSVSTQDIELLEKAGHIALIAIERTRAQDALTDALAELKKSEGELRTIIDMIPQMIAVLAPTESALRQRPDARITGLTGDEARGAEFRRRVFHRRCRTPGRNDGRSRTVSRSRTNNEPDVTTPHRWFLIDIVPCAMGTDTSSDGTRRRRHRRPQAGGRPDPQREHRCAKRSIARRCSRKSSGHRRPATRATLVDKVAVTDSTVLILGETAAARS